MQEDVLNDFKKCIVLTVINPSLFLMNEYKDGKYYRKEMKQFERLLAKNVKKFKNVKTRDLSVGQIIAVKDESGFHRALITDIYNKNLMNLYEVFLIDHGNTIETNEDKIGLIKSDELKDKKLGAFEVILHGAQPVTLDIDDSAEGIFKKRVSLTWSVAAFKLVEDLIQRNPVVYVKCIKSYDRSISGEIYIVTEKKIISLGEMLCRRGYATLHSDNKSLSSDIQGRKESEGIEMKIPESALPRQIKNLRFYNRHTQPNHNLSDLTDYDRPEFNHRNLHPQNKTKPVTFDKNNCDPDNSIYATRNISLFSVVQRNLAMVNQKKI